MSDLCFARVTKALSSFNIMTLDSVLSPQVSNKYLILVDVKSERFKYQSGRAGDEAKSVSLPPKAKSFMRQVNYL